MLMRTAAAWGSPARRRHSSAPESRGLRCDFCRRLTRDGLRSILACLLLLHHQAHSKAAGRWGVTNDVQISPNSDAC